MVGLKAWVESPAGARSRTLFHKRIADGKKPFSWISVLEWGTWRLVLWPQLTSSVLGEDDHARLFKKHTLTGDYICNTSVAISLWLSSSN